MAREEQTFHITPEIGMQIYYDKAGRTWWGFYFSRETDQQIGDAWSEYRRDDVLLFRPQVTEWHHAASIAF